MTLGSRRSPAATTVLVSTLIKDTLRGGPLQRFYLENASRANKPIFLLLGWSLLRYALLSRAVTSDGSYADQRVVPIFLVGVHGGCALPPNGPHHSNMENHERRPPTSAVCGPQGWPDRFCVEDGRMLLATGSRPPPEGVRSG